MSELRWEAEDFDDMEKRMRVLSDEGHSLADDWADMARQAAADLCSCSPVYYRYRSALHKGEWNVVLPAEVPKDKSGWEIEPLFASIQPPPAVRAADMVSVPKGWRVEMQNADHPAYIRCEAPNGVAQCFTPNDTVFYFLAHFADARAPIAADTPKGEAVRWADPLFVPSQRNAAQHDGRERDAKDTERLDWLENETWYEEAHPQYRSLFRRNFCIKREAIDRAIEQSRRNEGDSK